MILKEILESVGKKKVFNRESGVITFDDISDIKKIKSSLGSDSYFQMTRYLDTVLEDVENIPQTSQGFEKFGVGLPLLSGKEKALYGFTEIVIEPKIFSIFPYIFDINLDLTVHYISSIIYRLIFGYPVGGVGLGAADLIGKKFTSSVLNILKLRFLNMMNEIARYGWAPTKINIEFGRDSQDPTILRIQVQEEDV